MTQSANIIQEDLIDILMEEHDLIIDVLTSFTRFADSPPPLRSELAHDLAEYVEFFQRFVDKWHHGKEEDILFATLVQAGVPAHAGPIAVMLAEHDDGREYVAWLQHLASTLEAGGSLDEFRARSHAFADLMHRHIMKENNVLYPLASDQLSAEAKERMSAQLPAFVGHHPAGEYDRLRALATSLVERYSRKQT